MHDKVLPRSQNIRKLTTACGTPGVLCGVSLSDHGAAEKQKQNTGKNQSSVNTIASVNIMAQEEVREANVAIAKVPPCSPIQQSQFPSASWLGDLPAPEDKSQLGLELTPMFSLPKQFEYAETLAQGVYISVTVLPKYGGGNIPEDECNSIRSLPFGEAVVFWQILAKMLPYRGGEAVVFMFVLHLMFHLGILFRLICLQLPHSAQENPGMSVQYF